MRRAFTLIELLVVIAIIAILAALLFPVFAAAKQRAKSATSISNVRQLVMATILYSQDSDDLPPLVTEGVLGSGRMGGYTFTVAFGGARSGQFDPARGSLFPYTKNAAIYGSPVDPTAGNSRQSFAFNGCLASFPPTQGLMATQSLAGSPEPSKQFLFAEEVVGEEGTNDGFFHPMMDSLATWHVGKNAMGFVDGHAKLVNPEGRYRDFVDASPDPCWPYNPWF